MLFGIRLSISDRCAVATVRNRESRGVKARQPVWVRLVRLRGKRMKGKLKLNEVWFKIVLLFVFSGFYILAIPYPQESRQFPQLLAAISLILTLAALAADFLRAQVTAGGG